MSRICQQIGCGISGILGKSIRLKSQICECPTLGRSTTAWKVFLDYVNQLGTVGRLRDSAMAFDATTISRFFRRDKCSYEDDRHAVQCPIGFNLDGDFRAVSFTASSNPEE
jgi:hypothetical protein